MSAQAANAIINEQDLIAKVLREEDPNEKFGFTEKVYFVECRVWHEILVTEGNFLIFAHVDDFGAVHTVGDFDEMRLFSV